MRRILGLLAIGLPAIAAGDDVHCDAQHDAPDELDLLQVQREARSLRVGQGSGGCPPVPPQCVGGNPEHCVYLDPECLEKSLTGCDAGGTAPECRYCGTAADNWCSEVMPTTAKPTTAKPTTAAPTTTTLGLTFVELVEQQTKKCLDYVAATANADAAPCNQLGNQLWAMSDQQELIVEDGRLCLTGQEAGEYYNTVLKACDGTNAQKWELDACNDGEGPVPGKGNDCLLVNKENRYCLDYSAVAGDKDNVYLRECHGATNQFWKFVDER